MTEQEYFDLHNQAKTDYERKLEALNIVFDLSNQTRLRQKNGYLAKLISEAMPGLSDEFTAKDVKSAILTLNPNVKVNRSSLSHSMKKLMDKLNIEIVSVGKGRRGTVYRKTILLAPTKW